MTTTAVLLEAPSAWVILCGDYDVSSRDELDSRFATAESSTCRHVYVDVAWVTFIDCAALAMLARARRRLAVAGVTMSVVGASPRFERVCRLSGYTELLC